MDAQITPTSMEVSDRFPMLSFTIRSGRPMDAEVALASDPSLFRPENRSRRNTSNFYSSREDGMTHISAWTRAFDVPARVLARFVGTERLYFALTDGSNGDGGLNREPLLHAVTSSVSLRNFTGRTLR